MHACAQGKLHGQLAAMQAELSALEAELSFITA
jgi:hypothetical protein